MRVRNYNTHHGKYQEYSRKSYFVFANISIKILLY